MYLKIAEIIICTVVIWFIITQIIIPGFYGTKSFPLFKKEAKLKDKLVEVQQEIKEKELEETINKAKEKLKEKNVEEETVQETINAKEKEGA
jgi:predicted Holliday junction resolvase-like endonuclease